jgi:hypothetical protein
MCVTWVIIAHVTHIIIIGHMSKCFSLFPQPSCYSFSVIVMRRFLRLGYTISPTQIPLNLLWQPSYG